MAIPRATVGGAGVPGPAPRGLCFVTVPWRYLGLRHCGGTVLMEAVGWRGPEGFR
ncbi:hypothetical protein [Corallococcus sp. CA049B]|uniref:hypothetical protein n=1 Tax=Corallococcus sp. CA049B TaxID=2316730 RepID=UPI001315A3C9|nr:hypothetical protein [Corallococcus sp. CA049B]